MVVDPSMHISELTFPYPDSLVALEPIRPSRVMWVENSRPVEISFQQLLGKIPRGDVLVVNNTKVLKRRVFVPWKKAFIEILFLTRLENQTWEVLFPAKEFKVSSVLELPDGVKAELIEKGRPQKLKLDRDVNEDYFAKNAEIPLPPYIQKLRPTRHSQSQDDEWYQTAWAKEPGSLASPTASLHFSSSDMELLKANGVQIVPITLHVGLGTFLPVTTENLNDFEIHGEMVEIPLSTWITIQKAKSGGNKVWTLGTTSTRAIESVAQNLLPLVGTEVGQCYKGITRIFIKPGYEWKVVDRLMTNFHQPESTLLALVAAFSDLGTVKACYKWAIECKFRLFSYGDLSVWIR
ncbi:MAG: tRNA preQ1(34) S-adenosylmethionine ribosyltransferase-isomerase QueA [Bdellovibrionota bacterium]